LPSLRLAYNDVAVVKIQTGACRKTLGRAVDGEDAVYLPGA
jgi:hypothetical protein